jgi:hypothetical protein
VAYAELSGLADRIAKVLDESEDKLDSYSRAHLLESGDRIEKVLDARLTFSRP